MEPPPQPNTKNRKIYVVDFRLYAKANYIFRKMRTKVSQIQIKFSAFIASIQWYDFATRVTLVYSSPDNEWNKDIM